MTRGLSDVPTSARHPRCCQTIDGTIANYFVAHLYSSLNDVNGRTQEAGALSEMNELSFAEEEVRLGSFSAALFNPCCDDW